MLCNQNGLTCINTTKTPEDRIRIKKPAFARTTHRFWYLQNVSYYTNTPGVKEGRGRRGKDEREGRETDGGRERREKNKKVRT